MTYPLGVLQEEADMVVDRLNEAQATTAILLQMAVSSVLSEDAGKEFNKTIKKLSGS